MKLIIDIPYYNLDDIQNGSIACGQILKAVRNGKPYEDEQPGDLISRDALKKAINFVYDCAYIDSKSKEGIVSDIIDEIDNAPTVDTTEQEEFAYNEGYAHGLETKRPQGEWEDYSVDFYRCPECGYLLNKDCPHCQNKVILPKGGAE